MTGADQPGIGAGISCRLSPWLAAALVNGVLLLGFAALRSDAVISVIRASARPSSIDPVARLHFLLHIAMLAVAWSAISVGCATAAGACGQGLRGIRGRARGGERISARWGACAMALAQTLLWLLLAVDLEVFQLLGVHLDDYAVVEAIGSRGFLAEVNAGMATYLSVAVFAAAVFLANLALSSACLRWFRASGAERRCARLLSTVAVLAVTTAVGWSCCTLRAITQDPAFLDALPLFRSAYRVLRPAVGIRFRYPDPSLATRDPLLGDRKSVILVVFESFRSDAIDAQLTPNLYALSRRQGCVAPRYSFAGSHETAASLFSLIYGLDAFYLSNAAEQGARSWPLSAMKRNGYRLLGASAARLRGWSQSDVWISDFDEFHEFAGSGDYNDDEALASWGEEKISRLDPDRPFLLLLFFHATHHNYYYPPRFEIDRPVLPADYDHFMGDEKLARFRTEVVNRYRNSVRYSDQLFARVLAAADRAAGAGGLVLAVTGDHGEEFWDQGLLGHSAARLINARTRVPLLICAPGLETMPVAVAGHEDFFPTLFDILALRGCEQSSSAAPPASGGARLGAGTPLGLECPPVHAALYSDGRSLLAVERRRPSPVVVSAAHRPPGRREVAVIDNGCKYQLRETLAAGRFAVRGVTGLDDESPPSASECPVNEEVLGGFERELSRFGASGARGVGGQRRRE